MIAAAVLIGAGVAKLVAAAAMWYRMEWGRYLLAGVVAALLRFDVGAAVRRPSVPQLNLVAANVAAVWMLAVVLRPSGGRPGTPRPRR